MMSEKRIEEIAAEVASPASRYLPYWRTAVDFARAIEAECRVPEGYVLVPVEPSDSQLDVAVSFALNVRICSDYNWSAYMRDVYARMIAAAPKPDPERKHEIVPTIAAPEFINFARAILAEAVPQCTHEYEIDSDHPNHSCCQNCGEILKDGVHVQPVAQARSRAGMLAAAEMERSKGK